MPKLENQEISLADIYPQLSEEELHDAEENIRRYLAVVRQIFMHIEAEEPKVLTELRRRATLRKKKAHR